jgi:catechol 2,3-dioxygenase-like lactoylglutathione lyase family enzyme
MTSVRANGISATLLASCLAIALAASLARSAGNSSPPQSPNAAPVLINTALITSDVGRLAAFYTEVLQTPPHKAGDSYVEFRTAAGVLALFAADAQEEYIPGSATPAQNRSVILEFKVNNVDHEYARLHAFIKQWVKGPTTQPWGTRSIYFRDPDGNLVDFFTWVRPRQNF